MATRNLPGPDGRSFLGLLARKDVLAGLMFMAIAILGLWISRNYPIGTALRMSTGYVPRLLCWVLLLLGGVITVSGIRSAEGEREPAQDLRWRPLILIPAALVAFGLSIERLGIIAAGALLIGINSLASRDLRPVEIVPAAIVLIFATWAIFVWGLGLTIPVWPEW
ncbi:MAG TPA: tripartite tricarboxylate transporter TctB family protein [Beijerinckiaceae bacterium]|nr:tripartite tricarboxylate transporter TctB family protein [Beijerinckiaceae bacterium]